MIIVVKTKGPPLESTSLQESSSASRLLLNSSVASISVLKKSISKETDIIGEISFEEIAVSQKTWLI